MTTRSQASQPPAELATLFQQATRDHHAGRLAEAAAAYQQVLALDPGIAEAHYQLGNLRWQQGQTGDAAARFEQAIGLKPHFAEAHNDLGIILAQQGRLEPAAARFEQVIALVPDYAEAHSNLGNIRWQQGKLEQATAHFEQALARKPDLLEALNNLGNVLWQQGRLDEAAARYRQALKLDPQSAEVHNNLGSVLWKQGEFDQAVAQYRQAVALKPDYIDALSNLGRTLREQFKLEDARRVFERLESLHPGSPQAQMGLGMCYLLEGDYERGWPALEGRLRLPGAAPQPNLPRWTGQPLVGRSLLLVAEAGLGDTLQFVRYARLLKERGARVVLAVQPALGRLLAAGPDWDEVFMLGAGQTLPSCDFYLPLMSAPYALGTTAATIPRQVPYVEADRPLTEHWREELAGIDGFKIGIVWQTSLRFVANRWRSIPLAEFAPLAREKGVRLISLQKGHGAEQIAEVDFPVLDFAGRLDEAAGPFMDTAAVIRNLDLIVTSDTAIAHLAGALGAPVWVALNQSNDWRWLRDRDDSPWYPSLRLFRQTAADRWADVFGRMAEALAPLRCETSRREGRAP